MTELKALDEAGHALVSESFMKGETALTEEELQPYLQSTGLEIEFETLDEVIASLIDEHKPGEAIMDKKLAPALHRELDLTRREAAHDGIWHYLTVLRYPEFVRHRWADVSAKREKFLKGGEDIYSNALHRLWWIAEISRNEDDYGRTEEMLELQELANDIADRWFARYTPITYACIDVLKRSEVETFAPANSKIISDTTTQLRQELTVVAAESLSYPEAVELVTSLRDEIVADLR